MYSVYTQSYVLAPICEPVSAIQTGHREGLSFVLKSNNKQNGGVNNISLLAVICHVTSFATLREPLIVKLSANYNKFGYKCK